MYQFQQNLIYIKSKVKIWNRDFFENIQQEKAHLKAQLANLQRTIMQEGYTKENKEEGKILQEALDSREKQEKTIWKSKYWNKWLLEWEINTSFFHKTMIHYR